MPKLLSLTLCNCSNRSALCEDENSASTNSDTLSMLTWLHISIILINALCMLSRDLCLRVRDGGRERRCDFRREIRVDTTNNRTTEHPTRYVTWPLYVAFTFCKDLSQRVNSVREENSKLKSENEVL